MLRTPRFLELAQLGLELRIELASLEREQREAPPAHARDRLAQLAHPPPLEREARRLDERLLAGAEHVQPQAAIALQVPVRGAPEDNAPAALVRGFEKRAEQLALPPRWRHGIARDDRGLTDHLVGEHALGGEVEGLVGAQHEGTQRVLAEALDDRASDLMLLGVVAAAARGWTQQPARGQRARRRGGEHGQLDQHAQPGTLV